MKMHAENELITQAKFLRPPI
jgi:hypothetical protein